MKKRFLIFILLTCSFNNRTYAGIGHSTERAGYKQWHGENGCFFRKYDDSNTIFIIKEGEIVDKYPPLEFFDRFPNAAAKMMPRTDAPVSQQELKENFIEFMGGSSGTSQENSRFVGPQHLIHEDAVFEKLEKLESESMVPDLAKECAISEETVEAFRNAKKVRQCLLLSLQMGSARASDVQANLQAMKADLMQRVRTDRARITQSFQSQTQPHSQASAPTNVPPSTAPSSSAAPPTATPSASPQTNPLVIPPSPPSSSSASNNSAASSSVLSASSPSLPTETASAAAPVKPEWAQRGLMGQEEREAIKELLRKHDQVSLQKMRDQGISHTRQATIPSTPDPSSWSDRLMNFAQAHPTLTHVGEQAGAAVGQSLAAIAMVKLIDKVFGISASYQQQYEQASMASHNASEKAIRDMDQFLAKYKKGASSQAPHQQDYDRVLATLKDSQALVQELQQQGSAQAAQEVETFVDFLKGMGSGATGRVYNIVTHPVEYFKDMTVGMVESMGKLIRIVASFDHASNELVHQQGILGSIFFNNFDEQYQACEIYKQKIKNLATVFKHMPLSKKGELVGQLITDVLAQKNIMRLSKTAMVAAKNAAHEAGVLEKALTIVGEYEKALSPFDTTLGKQPALATMGAEASMPAAQAEGLFALNEASSSVPKSGGIGKAVGEAGQTGSSALTTNYKMPHSKDILSHIFRKEAGHLLDTPENRKLLLALVNDSESFLGKSKWGVSWFAKELPNGKQLWAEVYNGVIRNGGLNETVQEFNEVTGLKKLMRTLQSEI